MTITEALNKYKDIEIELLLGHVLNKPKEFLYLHPEKKLTVLQTKKLTKAVNDRRKGLPAAYILGYKYFYGLKFKVTRDTLIPRPESEWLVEKTLRILAAKRLKNKDKVFKILDMATGTGCIAVSIAKHCQDEKVEITASDVSTKALSIARSNAKSNKATVKFLKSNLFSKITGQFDIIIANLPYVPISDYKKFYRNLKYEPKLALTDGTDRFILLNEFLEQSHQHLQKQGVILIEVDPKFFKNKKQQSWRIVKDIHSLDRFALMEGKPQTKR